MQRESDECSISGSRTARCCPPPLSPLPHDLELSSSLFLSLTFQQPPISSPTIFLHHLISLPWRKMAVILIFFLLLVNPYAKTADSATFTLINRCSNTIWPGILSSAGSPALGTTGFELPTGTEVIVEAPTGWSGRFWGRTGCGTDGTGRVSCVTGDCGSGRLQCDGAGATPPATLAEFTLNGDSGKDFYDVSLVDGFNLPMTVEVKGGSGECLSTGCEVDLNLSCPAELRVGSGGACRSACEAFGADQFCCSGLYASPRSCQPSAYSQVFKSACPRAYSYAFDDATSTFTCTGADYVLTFCPSAGPHGSLKSSQDSTTDSVTAEPDVTPVGGTTQSKPWLASLAAAGATIHGTCPSLLVLASLVSAASLLRI